MDDERQHLTILPTDDGVIVLGPENALAALDDNPGLVGRPLKGSSVATFVADTAQLGSVIAAKSGRWLKLTDESVEFLRANGVKQVTAGVVRDFETSAGGGTQITKWLRFQPNAVLSPDVMNQVATYALQEAIKQSLKEITEYLKEIDHKLDKLIQTHKDQQSAALDGVEMAIHEAETLLEKTGHLTDVTWSKVQMNGQTLMDSQALALRSLNSLADEVRRARHDVGATAKAMSQVRNEAQFWLAILARAISIQDRQYLLELARIQEAHPGDLVSHREGITVARRERLTRIGSTLDRIHASVIRGAALGNREQAFNPFDSRAISRDAARVHREVVAFAKHSDVDLARLSRPRSRKWARAVRGMVQEDTERLKEFGSDVGEFVGERAQAVPEAMKALARGASQASHRQGQARHQTRR